MKASARSQLIRLGATAVVSSLLTLFIKNFISGEKKIKRRIRRRYDIADGQFERSMSQLLGPPILSGNRIIAAGERRGDLSGDARRDRTARRRRSVSKRSSIWSGKTAEQFSIALSAKAREGVKVHVLIDGMGCDCT
jgi:cardiolipin synthase